MPKVGVVLAQNRARRTPLLASLLARFKERKGKERWFPPALNYFHYDKNLKDKLLRQIQTLFTSTDVVSRP